MLQLKGKSLASVRHIVIGFIVVVVVDVVVLVLVELVLVVVLTVVVVLGLIMLSSPHPESAKERRATSPTITIIAKVALSLLV